MTVNKKAPPKKVAAPVVRKQSAPVPKCEADLRKGVEFGFWVIVKDLGIVEFAKCKHKRRTFKCRCTFVRDGKECGKVQDIPIGNILGGKSKSCMTCRGARQKLDRLAQGRAAACDNPRLASLWTCHISANGAAKKFKGADWRTGAGFVAWNATLPPGRQWKPGQCLYLRKPANGYTPANVCFASRGALKRIVAVRFIASAEGRAPEEVLTWSKGVSPQRLYAKAKKLGLSTAE